ncbi:DoxX family protein [Streptomyces sp. NPDC051217]|uniref:DoxX family protein n=1 Tax=Streptomyces sp. NPDC051217 TaxID=3365644 RepID=UPI00379B17BD
MSFTQRRDIGLLALRLGVGSVLIANGSQKLFGWFGGGGIRGTTEAMDQIGFTPPRESAIAAGVGETASGTLLVLGLATPAAGAAAAGAMSGAVSVHAPAGFFSHSGGFEHPALVGLVAAALGITGPGRYSLDHFTGHTLDRPGTLMVAFALSAAAATVVVSRRIAVLAERRGIAATNADNGAASA